MKYTKPPKIKIYEALGAIADGRLKYEDGEWRLYSSSGNKFYNIEYDKENKIIYSNDNGTYWKRYFGYPIIAFLMNENIISYDREVAKLLRDVKWKDINIEFKNDFEKTIEYCNSLIIERNGNLNHFLSEIEKIEKQIDKIIEQYQIPMKRKLPPKAY